MKLGFILLILLSFKAWSKVDSDFSGNVEAQHRHSWNNKMAKDDLFQDWDEEDFFLMYGNLNGKFEFDNSRIESNLFARYAHSDLFKSRPAPLPPFAAPQIFTFPNKLVARDLFKLQHTHQDENSKEELILNKFFYETSLGNHRFMAGRMYINYGQGEIFNPINPFNQPTGLTSISQVAQGNDGFNFTYYASEGHTIDLYYLGDKSFDDYEGKIISTIWVHGEYQLGNELQIDYVLGQDQKRDKLGGQIRYNLTEAMIFAETLYQSDYVDDTPSNPLWDFMLGYDQQMTSKWHLRAEAGYQKTNRFTGLNNTLNERFLPTEYFIAFANQFEIHPLIKLGGTIVNDVKTGFTYFITRNTFDLGHNTELDIFGYIPLAKGDDIENPAQKLVTTDVGMALRTFF